MAKEPHLWRKSPSADACEVANGGTVRGFCPKETSTMYQPYTRVQWCAPRPRVARARVRAWRKNAGFCPSINSQFTLYSFMQAVHVIRLKKEGDWPSPFTIGKPHRLAAERQQRLQSLTLDLGGPVLAAAASAAAVAASLRWPGPAPVPEGPTSTSLAEAQRLANLLAIEEERGRACSAARRRAQPLDRRATRGCDRRPGPGHAGRAAPAGQPASPLAATTGALGARGRGAPRPPSASLRQGGSDY